MNGGVAYGGHNESVNCYNVVYDVNGDKQPNELGRDMFFFGFCRTNSNNIGNIAPAGFRAGVITNPIARNTLITNCNRISNTNMDIWGYCTKLIKEDGWEFKDDYPKKL